MNILGGFVNNIGGFVKDRLPKNKPAEFQKIDGKAIAETITKEIAAELTDLKAKTGKAPGLAVVIVGSRGDSQTYVNMKKKKCKECGIESYGKELPETVSQEELLKVVQDFNADPNVHGILVQLPLPKHIDEATILSAISIEKDVDGFHPLNIGALCMKGRDPLFVPCTPKGCIELLDRMGVEMKGKHAVVLGRSNIVGMPAALLLLKRDATVSIVHSRTVNPEAEVRRADILISCCGQAQIVKSKWIKKGAVIIDVGTNAVPDASKKAGFRLVGDCDYAEVSKTASMCTPVPGGVGPMTIAMLMRNTADSVKRAYLKE